MQEYDILVRDSALIDGTGRPSYRADLGVIGERIAATGEVRGDARLEIDAKGMVLCPGFIDPHTHGDLGILGHPRAENFVMQGITTIVTGHCGASMAPLAGKCPSDLVNAWDWWHELGRGSKDPPLLLPLDEYGALLKTKLGFAVDWTSFDEFLSRVEKTGTSVNFASFVGHSTVRVAVMGEEFKHAASCREIDAMKQHVSEALEAGAFGLSSMTDPGPAEFADVNELVELARLVADCGGFYVPHTRHTQSQWPSDSPDEIGYGIFHGPMEDVWVGRYRGVQEALEVARRSGVSLHIAHLSNVFKIPQPHPDYLEEAAARATVEILDDAVREGIDVTFDVIASGKSISAATLLRDEFDRYIGRSEGAGLAARVRSDEFKDEVRNAHRIGRLKLGMVHTKADPYWMNCFRILKCANQEYEGKTVGQIAAAKGQDPIDTILDVLAEDADTIWVQFLDDRGTDTANVVFLRHPLAMPCTDAEVHGEIGATDSLRRPPPTAYDMFPQYISTMVREKGLLSIEHAVMKATSLPARRFGLVDRGVVKPGAFADIVLFDPGSVRGVSDFMEPMRYPEGIELVVVNGRLVSRRQKRTEERPGKVLRRGAGQVTSASRPP
ncbi:MAG: amidohydrolase family protein [Candidatus Thermoplasmatota archaeon]|nr:amidohydrolase family protein [Candidatus Thermoplasmatota archaeon]